MSEIVTWAWHEEKHRMVHIDNDNVSRGFDCGCICDKCGKPLNARRGEKNKHSFAHRPEDGDCHGMGESSIHLLAKQVICEEKKVMLPSFGYVIPQGLLEFESVEPEDTLEKLGLRPDVVGIDKEGKKWAIEIYYSNPKSESQKAKYIEAQINCLEINVNDISPNQDKDATELKHFLFNSINNREWIYPNQIQYNENEDKRKLIHTDYSFQSSRGMLDFPRVGEVEHSNMRNIGTIPVEEKIDYKDEIYISELDNESWAIKKKELSGNISEDLLSQLNENQQEAVKYCDGPSLVIAGAGSGKTRVLTYKIAALLQLGLKPWNILALTFTNKAAREMKERIGKLVGMEQAKYLNMGTFHSVFSHILRSESNRIGYVSNFTIYDQSDARSLVKTIIREMGLDDKIYKASSIADRISMAKNHILLPTQYAVSAWAADDNV